VNGDEPLAVEV